MDYVITNPSKKIYIRLDTNGTPETCVKQMAQYFEYSKARNILDHMPKTMKKFHFTVEPVPEVIVKEKEENSNTEEKYLENNDYEPSENTTRWIQKFGVCGDILSEAEEREKKLIEELKTSDKNFLIFYIL